MSESNCIIIFQVLEPPAEYLEEDITSKDDQRVPPDALYMLQSIRYCTDCFVVIFHGPCQKRQN